MMDLFGTDTLFDPEDFIKLCLRLGIDLVFTTIVIVFVYYRIYRSREFVFTCFIFNVVTYTLCMLLRKTPMDMGFALGLFAIFGILRYRTQEIRTRDLTYLFIVLGLAIINAVANKKISLAELLLVNALIAGLTAGLEYASRARGHGATPILYDKLQLLRPGNEEALLADLRARTGLPVVHVQVHNVDLLRDSAEITAYHGDRSRTYAEVGVAETRQRTAA